MNQMVINDLVDGLLRIFSNNLASIILYGSVARGTDTSESDIDIAVILKEKPDVGAMDSVVDFAVDMDMKYDKVFSIIDIDGEEFSKWEDVLPFYKNVKKDGVILWKTA